MFTDKRQITPSWAGRTNLSFTVPVVLALALFSRRSFTDRGTGGSSSPSR
jgi:hypothetical protein